MPKQIEDAAQILNDVLGDELTQYATLVRVDGRRETQVAKLEGEGLELMQKTPGSAQTWIEAQLGDEKGKYRLRVYGPKGYDCIRNVTFHTTADESQASELERASHQNHMDLMREATGVMVHALGMVEQASNIAQTIQTTVIEQLIQAGRERDSVIARQGATIEALTQQRIQARELVLEEREQLLELTDQSEANGEVMREALATTRELLEPVLVKHAMPPDMLELLGELTQDAELAKAITSPSVRRAIADPTMRSNIIQMLNQLGANS